MALDMLFPLVLLSCPRRPKRLSPTPSLSESLVALSLPSHTDKVLSFSVCVHGSTEVQEMLEEEPENQLSHNFAYGVSSCQYPKLHLPQINVKIRSVFSSVVDTRLSALNCQSFLSPSTTRQARGCRHLLYSSQDHRYYPDQSSVPNLIHKTGVTLG